MKPRNRLPGGRRRQSPPDLLRFRPETVAKVKLQEQLYRPRRPARERAQSRHTLTRRKPPAILRRGGQIWLNGFGPQTRFEDLAHAVAKH